MRPVQALGLEQDPIAKGIHGASQFVADKATQGKGLLEMSLRQSNPFVRKIADALGVEPMAQALSSGAQIPAMATEGETSLSMAGIGFHGSPHLFDKFDISKIGTGEGAQAFGHGLYFAENPKVAGEYARVLGNNSIMPISRVNDATERLVKSGLDEGEAEVVLNLAYEGGFTGKTGKELSDFLSEMGLGRDEVARITGNPDAVREILEYVSPRSQNLYKVDIPDEKIEKMLDWDKPLSEQPKELRSAIYESLPGDRAHRESLMSHPRFGTTKTGGDFYRQLVDGMGGNKSASEYLHSKGIPGIKYLDQGSREAGKGTRNFVLFSDKDVKILERNSKKVD